MHSACGRYVISFNGEIYNHRALRKELEGRRGEDHPGPSRDRPVRAECPRRGRRLLRLPGPGGVNLAPQSADENEVVIQAAGRPPVGSGGWHHDLYDGLVGPWFLPTFTAATGLDALDYVVLLPSEDRCVEHVAGRTGHEFTDEGATEVHPEFAHAAVEPRHVVVPAHRPEDVAERVVDAMADGSLRHGPRAR